METADFTWILDSFKEIQCSLLGFFVDLSSVHSQSIATNFQSLLSQDIMSGISGKDLQLCARDFGAGWPRDAKHLGVDARGLGQGWPCSGNTAQTMPAYPAPASPEQGKIISG
jgi:hypothetical protein